MEKSKRVGAVFQSTCYAAIIALLAGCGFDSPLIRTKSETELAVSAIKSDWLMLCVDKEKVVPQNQVGALLQDYVDMAEVLAICMKRHNDFVGYIKPIVEKERTR